MSIHKIFFITAAATLLYAVSAPAVPIRTEPASIEQDNSQDTSSAQQNLSVITLSAESLPMEPSNRFEPEPFSLNEASRFFSTLLYSLTYEIKFTPLGRLYTAIPQALNAQDHPLFSYRLLPHPEVPQSTALLNINHLVINQKGEPVAKTEKPTIVSSVLWLSLTFLALTGAVAAITWHTRKITVLHI
ncbi:MAG: hypothetical protein NPIRA04_32080 [Nitrospirales bacterium]|nr:MAG: hypothetical protein NPIRA04_32080 [Nitrospirales bacterium]